MDEKRSQRKRKSTAVGIPQVSIKQIYFFLYLLDIASLINNNVYSLCF